MVNESFLKWSRENISKIQSRKKKALVSRTLDALAGKKKQQGQMIVLEKR